VVVDLLLDLKVFLFFSPFWHLHICLHRP
jgi:hypothetical protein